MFFRVISLALLAASAYSASIERKKVNPSDYSADFKKFNDVREVGQYFKNKNLQPLAGKYSVELADGSTGYYAVQDTEEGYSMYLGCGPNSHEYTTYSPSSKSEFSKEFASFDAVQEALSKNLKSCEKMKAGEEFPIKVAGYSGVKMTISHKQEGTSFTQSIKYSYTKA
eukprot:Pgem_evm1s9061